MPRLVDGDQRRREIADAAFDIARERGLDAVTFRSVAARMGAASTTVVTHYAPTREALMGLLAAHVLPIQQRLIDEVIEPLEPVPALRVLVDALLPTRRVNRLMARLVFGPLADLATIDATHRAFLTWLRATINRLVSSLDPSEISELSEPSDSPGTLTELMIVAIAGTTTMALADPEGWPPDRQRAFVALQLDRFGLPMAGPARG